MRYLHELEERESAKEEGREEGREEGIEEGEKRKLLRQIQKKLIKGKSVEQIADDLEESPEAIRDLMQYVKT